MFPLPPPIREYIYRQQQPQARPPPLHSPVTPVSSDIGLPPLRPFKIKRDPRGRVSESEKKRRAEADALAVQNVSYPFNQMPVALELYKAGLLLPHLELRSSSPSSSNGNSSNNGRQSPSPGLQLDWYKVGVCLLATGVAHENDDRIKFNGLQW